MSWKDQIKENSLAKIRLCCDGSTNHRSPCENTLAACYGPFSFEFVEKHNSEIRQFVDLLGEEEVYCSRCQLEEGDDLYLCILLDDEIPAGKYEIDAISEYLRGCWMCKWCISTDDQHPSYCDERWPMNPQGRVRAHGRNGTNVCYFLCDCHKSQLKIVEYNKSKQ